jgi:hypothetical protein
MFLTRAGPQPLDIVLECPPDPKKLNILSSRRCSIQSLVVRHSDFPSPSRVRHEDLRGLNLADLRDLSLIEIGCKEAERIMDLALQSTHETIDFKLQESEIITASIIRHSLMRRVSNICLEAGKPYAVLSSAQLT